MTLSPETQAALIADGEKLAALTGEDHGPFPFSIVDGVRMFPAKPTVVP